jgi:hypothetical protein
VLLGRGNGWYTFQHAVSYGPGNRYLAVGAGTPVRHLPHHSASSLVITQRLCLGQSYKRQ